MTLSDFLLTRIAEDEDHYRRYPEPTKAVDLRALLLDVCEAKRQVVESLTVGSRTPSADYNGGYEDGVESTIRLLASVYADHSDYRDEWRP